MTKHWILFGVAILAITSCGDNKAILDKEKSLLESSPTKEIITEEIETIEKEIHAVSLKEASLLEKPETWSKTNPSVKNGKFYFGSKALLLETNEEGKRRYLKVRLNDGTEGWTSDWLIVEDANRAVVTTKSIRLYKKADIAAFTDKKIVIGQKVALGNDKVGGFLKVVYKGGDKKPYTFWVKEKDTKHISSDDNDYILSEYFVKIKTITNDYEKLELIDDIKDNEDYIRSPFYSKIISLAEELNDKDTFDIDDLGIDSLDLEDDF